MNKIYLGCTKRCKFFTLLVVLFFYGISDVAAQSCPDNDIGFGNDITANTFSICEGVSGTTIEGGAPAPDISGPTVYVWEVSTVDPLTGPYTTVSPNPGSVQNWTISAAYYNTPNTYYFRRVVSNSDLTAAQPCDGASDPVTLTVKALPGAPTAGYNAPLCSGANLLLTASNVPGATSYAWTGPNSYTSANQNPTINNVATGDAGTYSVTATVNGCESAPGSIVVAINPTPAAPTATNTGPVCEGGVLTLNATGVAGTYDWTGPNGFTSPAQQNPTIPGVTTASDGTYFVTVTAGGCTSLPGQTDAVVRALPASPTAGSNGIAPGICAGSTLNLTASNIAGATYSWTGPDGFTSSTQNPSIPNATTLAAGTYTVTATVNTCANTAGTVNVIVNALPAAPTAGSNGIAPGICAGSTLNLTASNVPGATYAWTGPNSFTDNTQNTTIPNATTAASGTYNVTATVNGCPGPAGSVAVIVNAIPASPTAGSNGTAPGICAGTALTLTASNVAGATYAWTGPNSFTSGTQNPTIPAATTAASGTYNVTATVNGCANTAGSVTVIVNAIPASPTAGSNGIAPGICAGSTLNLTATNVAGATYAWTGPNSFTSGTQNPSIPAATTAASGTYTVTATVNGCANTAGSVAVIVNAIPAAPTAGSNATGPAPGGICVGATLNLTASTVAGATYSWTGPNSFTSALQNPSITGATTAANGTYNVTATVAGCTSTSGQTVVLVKPVPPAPMVVHNGPLCVGATLNLNAQTFAGATYSWTGPSFTSTAQNPSITNIQTTNAGVYTVVMTVSGCAAPPVNAAPSPLVVNTLPAITVGTFPQICRGVTTAPLPYSGATGAPTQYSIDYDAAANAAGIPDIVNAAFTGTPLNLPIPAAVAAATYNGTLTVRNASCVSNGIAIQVVVKPAPVVNTVPNQTICMSGTSGAPLTINLTSVPAGATFSWTRTNPGGFLPGTGINLPLTNAGPVTTISGVLTNTQGAGVTVQNTVPQTTVFTASATLNGCTAAPVVVTSVTVNPRPNASFLEYNDDLNTYTSCTGGLVAGNSEDDIDVIQGFPGNGNGMWMYSPNVGGPFNPAPLPGNNSVNQYVFGTSTIRNTVGNHYFFFQSNIGGCITRSDTISLTIYLSNNAPTVNQPPVVCGSAGAINLNSYVTSNCGANTTLKWYDADYTAPGGGVLLATGAFNPNPAVTTTYYVACFNTSTSCESFRTAITVTRNNATAGSVGTDQVLCTPFDPALLTEVTAATGSGALTYQWQSAPTSCAGTFTNISGATGLTYDPPVIGATTAYRRVAISTQGASVCTANSNCVLVSYNNVTPGTIVGDQTNCNAFTPVAFSSSPAATGPGTLTYQWQSGTGGCAGSFTDIAGATGPGYAPPLISTTTYFRRIVTSTLNTVICTATSNCITITVNGPTAGVIGGTQTVCGGIPPALLTETTAPTGGTGTYTYTWQRSLTGCTSGFATAPGVATNATYQPPILTQTTYYRRIVTSGTCSVIGTTCVTVTFTASPVVGTLTVPPAPYCAGSNGTLTLTGSTGTLSWESSINGGPFTATGNTTNSLSYTNITQPTSYRVVVSTPTCGTLTSPVAAINIRNYWTGASSIDWNTGGNWADGLVPTNACPDVYIPGTPPNQPTVNVAVPAIINLHLLSGASLIVSGAGYMQIGGAITNTGATFNASDGKVEFNGTAATGGAQTIAANTFVGNAIKDIVISNSTAGGVTLGGPLDVFNSVTYGAAGTAFATAGNLTLKSTATATAWIGNLTGKTISGAVMVERYIPARKAWRFLGVPTQTTQTIHDSWQEGQAANSPTPSHLGIQITSDLGAINGFDVLSTFGPSMKTYNPGTNTYSGVVSTNAGFVNALGGYMTFIRGDRTVRTPAQAPVYTVLRTKGNLFTGTRPIITLTPLNAPYMNPYAAPLDLRILSPNNNTHYYVWDPNRGGNYGFGAFTALEWNGTAFRTIPAAGSPSYPGNIGNFIESGQAFFVSGSGALSIQENVKGGGSGAMVFRPASPAPDTDKKLYTSLFAINADSTAFVTDGTLSVFGDYSDAVDGYDARKLNNMTENLAIKTDSTLLVIERKQPITQEDTIAFSLTSVAAREYQFKFEAENMNDGTEGFLEDNYLHTRTQLDLSGTSTVNFKIVNVPGAYAADRFRIVFKPAAVLPVTFTSLKAYRQDKIINVEWNVEAERGVKQYELEKSLNGMQFTRLAILPATAAYGQAANYLSIDPKPVEGYNYYRVKSVDINGKTAYTEIVKVLVGSLKHNIVINPNPITDGVIHLQFLNQPEGKYGVRMMNKLGQVIVSKQITHPGGTNTELIKWDFQLAHGVYQLKITRPDGSVKNISVLY